MKTQESREIDRDAIATAERLVEALIFASPVPLPEAYLQDRIDVPLEHVLAKLEEFYSPPRAPRLIQVEGGWRFSCAAVLKDLPPPRKQEVKPLGETAKRVLACILWHQPVTLAAVSEFIGQRPNSATMKLLKNMGWIAHGERSQEAGQPMTWVTTQGLLEHLEFARLSDLPDPDFLQGVETVPEEPFSPATMPVAGRR